MQKRKYFDLQLSSLVAKVMANASEETRQKVLRKRLGPISNMECHDKLVKAFNRQCFNFAKVLLFYKQNFICKIQNPYATQRSFVLTNLCGEGIPVEQILKILKQHCVSLEFKEDIF